MMMRALCLILSLFALAVGPARADEAQSLIARHLAWRGGPALERITTLHMSGEIEAAGMKGAAERWSERPGREYVTFKLGAFEGASAVAQDNWSMEEGVVEDMPAELIDDTRRAIALEYGDALQGKGGTTLTKLADETRDGRTWSVVRVSFGGPDTYDAFIDPASGELLGYRIVENRKPFFRRFSDWRQVDGVRTPFAQEDLYENKAENVVYRLQKVELNRPVPAGLYARPAGKQIASFAGGASTTGPIAFDFYNGNRIYIPATVNGREVKVLLDSGADQTVLDKAFAESLGLKLEGEAVARGTGGQTAAWLARGVTVKVGAMTMANRTVAVIDLSDVSRRLGIPMPVILGEDVFKQLVVDIDFQAAKIAFHDPKAFKVPAGAATVPVAEAVGVRTVPVSIEGRPPVQVDFDIGNGSYFMVSPAFYEKEGLLKDGRPTSAILGGAVGGAREEPVATLKSVTFAGVQFHDVPATFSTAGKGEVAVDSDRSLGNVGQSILSRFRLITDYTNDKLYLVPHADAQTRPFRKDRAGLTAALDGAGLKVAFVSPGSPAAAGGWKAGDVITAIDGQPVTAAFNGSELSRWRFGQAGRTVTLTLADGTKRMIQLKDYF